LGRTGAHPPCLVKRRGGEGVPQTVSESKWNPKGKISAPNDHACSSTKFPLYRSKFVPINTTHSDQNNPSGKGRTLRELISHGTQRTLTRPCFFKSEFDRNWLDSCCCWLVVVFGWLFITAGPITKGERGTGEHMCYEIRRAETCVDTFGHHALVSVWEVESV
jgi:hypothetical protein